MNTIDIERLIQVTETASRLKAQWRALGDLIHESREQLQRAQRTLETRDLNRATYHTRDGLDPARDQLEARIAGLRALIKAREMELRTAADASAEAGRLAEACRRYAKQLGVALPGEDYEVEFIGTARPE